ncbi:hypothetical protein ACP70R_050065 [Stipagrostis hirtigluma subsp. patula]
MGLALRMRWGIWLGRMDPKKAWAGLKTRDDPAGSALFHASVTVDVGDIIGQESLAGAEALWKT